MSSAPPPSRPRVFGLDASLGSIEPGKTASLILLTANPLDDIGNTTKITAALNRGYHDRAALDKLLAEAKSLASDEPAAAAAPAGKGAVTLELPGDQVARGRYKVKFGNFDAGTEDFLITKTADGLHLIAHNQPKGGMQLPILVTLHLNPDRSFKSGSYQQLVADSGRAQYELRDNTLHATATRKGQALDPQALPVPDDASLTALRLHLRLHEPRRPQPQARRGAPAHLRLLRLPRLAMGHEPHDHQREPDTTLKRPDGKEVPAQRYDTLLKTPVGEFKARPGPTRTTSFSRACSSCPSAR